MNGKELISWAVNQCLLNKRPPTDGAILEVIRDWDGSTNFTKVRTGEAQPDVCPKCGKGDNYMIVGGVKVCMNHPSGFEAGEAQP